MLEEIPSEPHGKDGFKRLMHEQMSFWPAIEHALDVPTALGCCTISVEEFEAL